MTTKNTKRFFTLLLSALVAMPLFSGCESGGSGDGGTGDAGDGGGTATVIAESTATPDGTAAFSLAWSEYPSWSVFGVAHELGLIDGEAGMMGAVEKEFGIDIELKEAGYDSCLNMYSSGDCDAVCITNMDALIVSPSRDGVAVLPTSTSNGADACVVSKEVADIEGLKKHKVHGLKGTVSEYCFVRCIEKAGFDEADFQFSNQDPAIAAQNMQNSAETHQAIMVWNPFVLQTLSDRDDTRVLFDSSQIPGEIVDMVVIGRDSLEKPDADKFIKAVNEAFYRVNQALDDKASGDEVLVALGKKFSNLGLADMKTVVQQTAFYKTPAAGAAVMDGEEFKATMKTVEDFCVKHKLVENASVGYGGDATGVKLRFDSSYLK